MTNETQYRKVSQPKSMTAISPSEGIRIPANDNEQVTGQNL